MPRYYKYKRYYRRMYPRKRWASNFGSAQTRIMLAQGNNDTYASYVPICQNSIGTSTPTPVLLKVGRIKVKGDLQPLQIPAALQSLNALAYIVFVPQGIDMSNRTAAVNLIQNHPEYIMGWTQLSMDSANSFSITSSLKRNLNSGDSIHILFIITSNPEHPITANITYGVSVAYQFFTTSG